MPVEIRELIIRAVVAAPTESSKERPDREPELELDREALIQACVKQVLRILKKKEER